MSEKLVEFERILHPANPRDVQEEQACFEIGLAARIFAEALDRFCPTGRAKSLAFTKLEESVLWAFAANRNEQTNE